MKHRRGRTDETWAMAIAARNGLLRDNSMQNHRRVIFIAENKLLILPKNTYLPHKPDGTNKVKQRSGEMR
jgi:hypothetical protein